MHSNAPPDFKFHNVLVNHLILQRNRLVNIALLVWVLVNIMHTKTNANRLID